MVRIPVDCAGGNRPFITNLVALVGVSRGLEDQPLAIGTNSLGVLAAGGELADIAVALVLGGWGQNGHK